MKTTSCSLLIVAVGAALLASPAEAMPSFVSRVPNGANVPGAPAIGHTPDWTVRNAFGQAFDAEGKQWTKDLCEADSDADDQTNGQELGDPCCEWTKKSGVPPRWTEGVSHPGDATKTSDASLWASVSCSESAAYPSSASGSAHDAAVGI